MSTLMWNFIGTSVALFEIIVYFDYANSFFGRKNTNRFYQIVFILVFVENAVVSSIIKEPLLLLINTFFINIVISYTLFYGKYYLKMISAVIIMVLAALSEIISGLLILSLGTIDTASLLDNSPFRLAGIIISKIILFIIVKSIARYRKAELGKISFRYWILLMLIPLISIAAIYQIVVSITAKTSSILPLISTIGVMYINIIVFILFEAILRQSEIQYKYEIVERQLDNQIKYFQRLEESRRETNKIRHDMKNHMICLNSMASEGNLPAIVFVN
jgi:two-component system sensor histidine kinase AgrC